MTCKRCGVEGNEFCLDCEVTMLLQGFEAAELLSREANTAACGDGLEGHEVDRQSRPLENLDKRLARAKARRERIRQANEVNNQRTAQHPASDPRPSDWETWTGVPHDNYDFE